MKKSDRYERSGIHLQKGFKTLDPYNKSQIQHVIISF